MVKYKYTRWSADGQRLERAVVDVPSKHPYLVGFLAGFGLITMTYVCSFILVSIFQ